MKLFITLLTKFALFDIANEPWNEHFKGDDAKGVNVETWRLILIGWKVPGVLFINKLTFKLLFYNLYL